MNMFDYLTFSYTDFHIFNFLVIWIYELHYQTKEETALTD